MSFNTLDGRPRVVHIMRTNPTKMKNPNITVFTQSPIHKSPTGFGHWVQGESSPEFSFLHLSDLLDESEANGYTMLPLAEALEDADFRESGIQDLQDIRGMVYGLRGEIFVSMDIYGVYYYSSVIESKAPSNFFNK